MKRALIICMILVLSETAGYCDVTFLPPLQSINQNNSMQDYNNNITTLPDPFAKQNIANKQNLNSIEQSLYGRIFSMQNISIRLSRIEKTLFNKTYPNASEIQRLDNIISNYNQINKYPNISSNVLSRIESQVFNQRFPQYSPQRRIESLEQEMFGAVQSGDLSARYETLKIAAKNYRANNYTNCNPNAIGQTGWKGIASAIGSSLLGGTMTGFTPQIDPYCNPDDVYSSYMNTYPNSSGIYRGYRSNHGYRDDYQNYGSSSKVTILD